MRQQLARRRKAEVKVNHYGVSPPHHSPLLLSYYPLLDLREPGSVVPRENVATLNVRMLVITRQHAPFLSVRLPDTCCI